LLTPFVRGIIPFRVQVDVAIIFERLGTKDEPN
jgi:hypothetical protein